MTYNIYQCLGHLGLISPMLKLYEADPKSSKRQLSLQFLFVLLRSARVKAAHIMLVKSTNECRLGFVLAWLLTGVTTPGVFLQSTAAGSAALESNLWTDTDLCQSRNEQIGFQLNWWHISHDEFLRIWILIINSTW